MNHARLKRNLAAADGRGTAALQSDRPAAEDGA